MTAAVRSLPDPLPAHAMAAGIAPLAGFTVAVTAARRREELGALLERRGARVVTSPAIRIVPLEDDAELLHATHTCLSGAVDDVVVTTGIGFRGWIEAADGWGIGDALLGRLRHARILARGPKARGAIRAAGLVDSWSPASESSSEVLDHLLAEDLTGRRIVVQLHGEPLPDFVDALREAGADVIEVAVYRWIPPEDTAPLRRLVDLIQSRLVDAVTFTSAPAVASLLATAGRAGVREAVVATMQSEVLAMCVGPVTAAPLERLGIPTVQPDRARLGSMVRELVEVLPARQRWLPVGGGHLQIRGHGVVVGGALRPLAPAPMAVLRALARKPGVVLSRGDLVAALPGDNSDGHAVEMAVARLRAALGPRVVQTVVKRGYRLAYEPEATSDGCLSRP